MILAFGNSFLKCQHRSSSDSDVCCLKVGLLVSHSISLGFRNLSPQRFLPRSCLPCCSLKNVIRSLARSASKRAKYSCRTLVPEMPKRLPNNQLLAKDVVGKAVAAYPNFNLMISSTYCSVNYFMWVGSSIFLSCVKSNWIYNI